MSVTEICAWSIVAMMSVGAVGLGLYLFVGWMQTRESEESWRRRSSYF